jgi:hypothetical protein
VLYFDWEEFRNRCVEILRVESQRAALKRKLTVIQNRNAEHKASRSHQQWALRLDD